MLSTLYACYQQSTFLQKQASLQTTFGGAVVVVIVAVVAIAAVVVVGIVAVDGVAIVVVVVDVATGNSLMF